MRARLLFLVALYYLCGVLRNRADPNLHMRSASIPDRIWVIVGKEMR